MFHDIEREEVIQEMLETVLIVRLKRSYWTSKSGGVNVQITITPLEKKSADFTWFEEDVSNVGAQAIITQIVNLNKCVDGLYQLETCNIDRDYETGEIVDYDYVLIPYKEERK